MPNEGDPGVKARAVRLVRHHRQEYSSVTAAAAAVAQQLGSSRETVRRWVVRLREDVAILRAATSFFAGELDPRRTTQRPNR